MAMKAKLLNELFWQFIVGTNQYLCELLLLKAYLKAEHAFTIPEWAGTTELSG